MAFIPYKGRFKTIYLGMTTSTVVSRYAVASVSSGLLIAATSSTTALSHLGVFAKAIVAADSDYASARKVGVIVPLEKNCEWLADVTATLLSTDSGAEVDFTDSLNINRGASSVDTCMIRDFISTTKCTCVLKLQASY